MERNKKNDTQNTSVNWTGKRAASFQTVWYDSSERHAAKANGG
jgi:hypothetical protein